MMAHPSNSAKTKRLLEYYDGHNIRPGCLRKKWRNRWTRRKSQASVKALRLSYQPSSSRADW